MDIGKGFRQYIKGDRLSAREMNRLTRLATSMSKSLSSLGIVDSTGVHIRRQLSAPATETSKIHYAFPVDDAGDKKTITCVLDKKDGEEIEVYCSIAGGGYLNSAIPRLEKWDFVNETGSYLLVTEMKYYEIGGETSDYWEIVSAGFQASEDCVCS